MKLWIDCGSSSRKWILWFAVTAVCLWNVSLLALFLGQQQRKDTAQPSLSQATVIAHRIAHNEFPQAEDDDSTKIRVAEWVLPEASFVRSNNDDAPCDTVYSFGVGLDDPWTNFMAIHCRHVFAFDPTVTTYDNPNVTFHPWGLRNSDPHWSHPVYGTAVPNSTFLTFPQLQQRLSHDPSRMILSALKFDCEGCEYGAFEDGVPPARHLFTEFHLSLTLGMKSMQDLIRLNALISYLSHCQVTSYRPNRGFRRDRTVLPYLVEHGVPEGTCCYEYSFQCDFEAYSE